MPKSATLARSLDGLLQTRAARSGNTSSTFCDLRSRCVTPRAARYAIARATSEHTSSAVETRASTGTSSSLDARPPSSPAPRRAPGPCRYACRLPPSTSSSTMHRSGGARHAPSRRTTHGCLSRESTATSRLNARSAPREGRAPRRAARSVLTATRVETLPRRRAEDVFFFETGRPSSAELSAASASSTSDSRSLVRAFRVHTPRRTTPYAPRPSTSPSSSSLSATATSASASSADSADSADSAFELESLESPRRRSTSRATSSAESRVARDGADAAGRRGSTTRSRPTAASRPSRPTAIANESAPEERSGKRQKRSSPFDRTTTPSRSAAGADVICPGRNAVVLRAVSGSGPA